MSFLSACPRCGASVPVAGQGTVTCGYCGNSFSPRAPGSGGPPLGCLLGGVGLLVVIIAGVGAAFVALGGEKSMQAPTSATSASPVPDKPVAPTAQAPSKQDPPSLENRVRPLAADLNGDGMADVVVAASLREDKGMSRRYLALDGLSGARLWQTDDLGSDLFSANAVLEHGRFMIVNRSGKVRGFDGKSGLSQWEQSLGERVTAVCRAREPASVRFQTADGRTVAIDTGTGKATAIAGKPACERLVTSQEDRFGRDPADRSDSRAPAGVKSVVCGSLRVMGDRNFSLPEQCKAQFRIDPDSIPGMSARSLWQHEGGVLVFGSKRPGTRVPMVGFFKGGRLVWSSEVPAKDPLEAREGAPDQVALAGGRLVVGYEPQSGDKPAGVTAFDVATGARLWHVALPGKLRSISGLGVAGGGVFVSAGDNLVALSLVDGKQRFIVGDGD